MNYQDINAATIDRWVEEGWLWGIPVSHETYENAKNGVWRKAPGNELFKTVESALGKKDIIAEDLGFITDSVKKLLKDCQFPGMKILQFAFDSRDSSNANE